MQPALAALEGSEDDLFSELLDLLLQRVAQAEQQEHGPQPHGIGTHGARPREQRVWLPREGLPQRRLAEGGHPGVRSAKNRHRIAHRRKRDAHRECGAQR